MNLFRGLLIFMLIGIIILTIAAVANDGGNLLPHFVEPLLAMNWQGQFNVDFTCYLLLSALWIAWRHHFSLTGLVTAALASVLGILFFAPYLFIQSVQAKGDMKTLVLGTRRSYLSL